MLRAALYARVSSDQQEKERTIASQLAAITRYGEERGFHTTPALSYTDDGFSGTHLDRPALDELRDHAREGRFDVVVVLCPDRLARKYAYQVLLIEELERTGLEIHFCERPITDTPDDQLLLQIQGAIAEYERAKMLERVRRGRLHRARMGELGIAKPPYGYWRPPKKQGGDGRIRIHEEEAEMVRQVFRWYAEEGMTGYGLLKKMNASPWKTRSGRNIWQRTTLLRMLRCEWYVGRAYYNRTKSVRNKRPPGELPGRRTPKTTVTGRPRSEWIEVPVPPLIDQGLFDRVQERIEENRRFAKRRLKHEGVFLLRGLMKCGRCGYSYVGETKRSRRRDGSEQLYHYYLCGRRWGPLPEGGRTRCRNDRLRAFGANEAVWAAVRDLLLDSDRLARELSAWATGATSTSAEDEARTQRAERRVADLARQRTRLTDAYQFEALSLDVFQDRMEAVDEQHRAAQAHLQELQSRELEAEVARSQALGAGEMIEQLRPRLEAADFETRQQILRLLVERVVVNGQELEIHLALPVSSDFGLTSGELLLRLPEPAKPLPLGVGVVELGADRGGVVEDHRDVGVEQVGDLEVQVLPELPHLLGQKVPGPVEVVHLEFLAARLEARDPASCQVSATSNSASACSSGER